MDHIQRAHLGKIVVGRTCCLGPAAQFLGTTEKVLSPAALAGRAEWDSAKTELVVDKE